MTDWDAKYRAAPEGLFGNEPNEYLRGILSRSDFSAATALCLADGDGRNGTWLARQGLKVTAVELSAVATENARRRDRAKGVTVERISADLETWRTPAGQGWDAVFLIALHCPWDIRRGVIQRTAETVTPGGWFVIEGFAKAQAYSGSGGPKDPDLLYDLSELRPLFEAFEIMEALEGTILLQEGVRHDGEFAIVRFAARKMG